MGMPPDVVELLRPQSIPKTSSGKLRRSETRRLYLDGNARKKAAVGLDANRQAGRARRSARRVGLDQNQLRAGAPKRSTASTRSRPSSCVLIPLWIVVSLTRDPKRAARFTHSGRAADAEACAQIPVEIVGGEMLNGPRQSGPWIFAPNHSSYRRYSGLPGVPARGRAVRSQRRNPRHAVLRQTRRTAAANFSSTAAIRRLACSQAEDVNAALRPRRVGGRLSGRNFHRDDRHSPVSAGRIQSRGRYASARSALFPCAAPAKFCAIKRACRGAEKSRLLLDLSFFPTPSRETIGTKSSAYETPRAKLSAATPARTCCSKFIACKRYVPGS